MTSRWTRTGVLALVPAAWALTTTALARSAAAAWSDLHGAGPPHADSLVALSCCAAGLAVCAWLGLVTAAQLVVGSTGRGHGHRAARRGTAPAAGAPAWLDALTPTLVHKLVAVALGVGLVAAGTSAAQAVPGPVGRAAVAPAWAVPDQGTSPRGRAVSPLWGAEAGSPATAGPAWGAGAPATTAPAPARGTRTVVVRRGECLWQIASRHLGPGATTAAVAAAWPRWYAVNRAVVGPDPDAVQAGTRLVVPAEFAR